MSQTLATVSEALEWAQAHWHENRAVPDRLHRGHMPDGALGGLRYSGAFAAAVGDKPNDTIADERTVRCYHPLLSVKREARDCPECGGSGLKLVETDRYRYAMWRALVALQNGLRPRRQPHPYELVLDLVAHSWDARAAAQSRGLPWDLAEALFLRALRQLHGRYQEGPVGRPSWIAKSDSQRAAESAA